MSPWLWLLWGPLILAILALAHAFFWGWIYRVRPDSDALLTAHCADGWDLSIAHFQPPSQSSQPPVILCHGLAANRLNLCLPGRHSLAAYLRARGFEVFVCDLRGAGDSARPPPGKRFGAIDFEAHLDLDAPAILALALATSGKPKALWVGHSMGGLLGLALAESSAGAGLAGVVALGSPTFWGFHRAYLKRISALGVRLALGGRLRQKALVRFVAPFLIKDWIPLGDIAVNPRNMSGPVYRQIAYHVVGDMPRALLAEFAGWIARDAWDTSHPPRDLRLGLAEVQCPVLLVGGSSDVLAPPRALEAALARLGSTDKSLVLLGRERGDAQDYGHGDLIFGLRAPEEVFPLVERWLGAHGSGAGEGTTQATR